LAASFEAAKHNKRYIRVQCRWFEEFMSLPIEKWADLLDGYMITNVEQCVTAALYFNREPLYPRITFMFFVF
jgi:hypothetical protein